MTLRDLSLENGHTLYFSLLGVEYWHDLQYEKWQKGHEYSIRTTTS